MRKFYLTAFPLLALCAMPVQADETTVEVADFENLDLAPNSYWVGDTEDEDYTYGSFTSGSFEFLNFYMADYDSWAFYGYSNLTSTDYAGFSIENQMKNCVGGGYKSATFAVCYCDRYWGPAKITLPDFEDQGAGVNGMWVTNTAWVVDAIKNGDGMSGPFEQGDWLKIVVTGIAADETSRQVEFYLADFRDDDPENHFYLKEWKYFDLSELGDVVELRPTMESSKVNSYGPTTPMYFAFDDLGAEDASGVNGVESTAPVVRVRVEGGVAVVTADADCFAVEAVGVNGMRVEAQGSCGMARIQLPASGVNMLRVATAAGITTTKVMNR